MKIAILGLPVCLDSIAIMDHFKSNNYNIEAVIIEKGIRKKFSKSEIKFRNAHDKFNKEFKKYGLGRRIARQIWDNLIPKAIKNLINKNVSRIPFIKKFSTSNFAKGKNIPVVFTEKHSSIEVRDFILDNEIDYLLLGSSNWLLKEPILNIDSCEIISIHPGLLPEQKGLDSMQWSIKHGDKIGSTAFFIDESIDGGDILTFFEEPILEGDTTTSIQRRMSSKKPAFLLDVLRGLEENTITPTKQLKDSKVNKPMSYEELLEVEEMLQKMIQSRSQVEA